MIKLVFDELLNTDREPTSFTKSYTITSKGELYNVCKALKEEVPKNPLFSGKVVSVLAFGESEQNSCP